MKIEKTVEALKEQLSALNKIKKGAIGFAPTMGAIHQGHLSLIQESNKQCGVTVVSIFVNPTQFNNATDFENYPSTLQQDIEQLEKEGVDILFTPSPEAIYPNDTNSTYSLSAFGDVFNKYEGANRPGHFNGVAQVVEKLLHIVEPTHLFMGQKDWQQVCLIRKLIELRNLNIKLIACPTLRTTEGLAMSSRNELLSATGREKALLISSSLNELKTNLLKGAPILDTLQKAQNELKDNPSIQLEYLELVSKHTMDASTDTHKLEDLVLIIAAYVDNIRLIDNMPL